MRTLIIVLIVVSIVTTFVSDVAKLADERHYWLHLADIALDIVIIFGFIWLMGGVK